MNMNFVIKDSEDFRRLTSLSKKPDRICIDMPYRFMPQNDHFIAVFHEGLSDLHIVYRANNLSEAWFLALRAREVSLVSLHC